MPRKTGKLKGNKTFLLVVEGFTEQIYFSDVKTTRRIPGITINPKIAKHSDLSTILRTAIREYNTNAYDSVWCVFDRDTITEQGMSDDLKKQYNTALDLGIQFADSMPAFEVWFLLHFAMPSPFYISHPKGKDCFPNRSTKHICPSSHRMQRTLQSHCLVVRLLSYVFSF